MSFRQFGGRQALSVANNIHTNVLTANQIIGDEIKLDGVFTIQHDPSASAINILIGPSGDESMQFIYSGSGEIHFIDDVVIDNNIQVVGNLDLSGSIITDNIGCDNLTVNNLATFNGNVDISGDVVIDQTLTVSGDALLKSDLDICGNVLIEQNLTVLGSVFMHADVDISGLIFVDGIVVSPLASNPEPSGNTIWSDTSNSLRYDLGVGFGLTTNPSVNGALVVVDDIQKEFIVKSVGGAWTVQTTSAGDIHLCQDAGNVGIRTTAPTAILDVSGDARVRDILTVDEDIWIGNEGGRLTTDLGDFYIEGGNIAEGNSGKVKFTDWFDFPRNPTMTIDTSNQRVGIGTETPVEVLDVSGVMRVQTLDSTGALRLLTAGTPDIYMGFDDAATDLYSYTINANIGDTSGANYGLVFYGRTTPGGGFDTGNPSLEIFDSIANSGSTVLDGFGGIRTPNLVVKHNAKIDGSLNVLGNVDISGKLTVDGLIDPTGLVLTAQASNPAPAGNTIWTDTGNNMRYDFGAGFGLTFDPSVNGPLVEVDNTAKEFIVKTDGGAWTIQTVSNGDIHLCQDAGNVGIKTTSPSELLDVSGTGRIRDTLRTDMNSTFGYVPGTRGGILIKYPEVGVGYSDTNGSIQGITSSYDVSHIHINPAGGNVGIGLGTSTPSTCLEVNGDISCGGTLYTSVLGIDSLDLYNTTSDYALDISGTGTGADVRIKRTNAGAVTLLIENDTVQPPPAQSNKTNIILESRLAGIPAAPPFIPAIPAYPFYGKISTGYLSGAGYGLSLTCGLNSTITSADAGLYIGTDEVDISGTLNTNQIITTNGTTTIGTADLYGNLPYKIYRPAGIPVTQYYYITSTNRGSGALILDASYANATGVTFAILVSYQNMPYYSHINYKIILYYSGGSGFNPSVSCSFSTFKDDLFGIVNNCILNGGSRTSKRNQFNQSFTTNSTFTRILHMDMFRGGSVDEDYMVISISDAL